MSSDSSSAVFERDKYVNQALALRDNAFGAAAVRHDERGITPCMIITQPGSIHCSHQSRSEHNVSKVSLHETSCANDTDVAKENIRPTAPLHSNEGLGKSISLSYVCTNRRIRDDRPTCSEREHGFANRV